MFQSPFLFPQILNWNITSLSSQQLSPRQDTAGITSSTETLKYVMNQHLYWGCGKVLVAGGLQGVASVRSCQKLPLCPTDPVPASSKMDPLLAKAEPISYCGGTSGIKYGRREKNCSGVETGVRICVRKSPAEVSKEGGEDVLQTPEQSVFPCSP